MLEVREMRMLPCSAQVKNADVRMRDEPTDHLDVDSAEWLKEGSEVWLDCLISEAEVGSIYTAERW